MAAHLLIGLQHFKIFAPVREDVRPPAPGLARHHSSHALHSPHSLGPDTISGCGRFSFCKGILEYGTGQTPSFWKTERHLARRARLCGMQNSVSNTQCLVHRTSVWASSIWLIFAPFLKPIYSKNELNHIGTLGQAREANLTLSPASSDFDSAPEVRIAFDLIPGWRINRQNCCPADHPPLRRREPAILPCLQLARLVHRGHAGLCVP